MNTMLLRQRGSPAPEMPAREETARFFCHPWWLPVFCGSSRITACSSNPDSVQDAIAFVDALLETPGAEVCPSGHEWRVLRNKLMEGNLEGNLVTDAWIAAVVLHQSESLATFDEDFRQLLPAHALIFLDR